ncbi:MAG: tetratricopeptide repeat protein [Armatimonadetes bacterium]|nr:tetratricopeptide repeat protein [Armatimonadota bacterium]
MKGLAALAAIAWFPSLSWIGGGRLGSYLATVEGNHAYVGKEYGEAMKHYRAAQREDPTGGVPPYNLGTVLYRQRKYDKAINSFEQAINSEDASLQAQAYYNIGNCHFRANDLVKAIESYKKSLQLNPKDADTKFNLELARRKLKEMAQKQQKKQNQQQQQQQRQQQQSSSQAQQGKKQQDQQDKGKQSSAEKKQAQATKKGQQPHGKKAAMSAEDARRLLQAIAQQEKDTRKRASKMMQQPGEYPVDKDW